MNAILYLRTLISNEKTNKSSIFTWLVHPRKALVDCLVAPTQSITASVDHRWDYRISWTLSESIAKCSTRCRSASREKTTTWYEISEEDKLAAVLQVSSAYFLDSSVQLRRRHLKVQSTALHAIRKIVNRRKIIGNNFYFEFKTRYFQIINWNSVLTMMTTILQAINQMHTIILQWFNFGIGNDQTKWIRRVFMRLSHAIKCNADTCCVGVSMFSCSLFAETWVRRWQTIVSIYSVT